MAGKIYYSFFDSSFLKRVFVASSEKGICMVDFHKSEEEFLKRLKRRFHGEVIRNDRKNKDVLLQIKKYLRGELKKFSCKLDLRGTHFQKKVWLALKNIPFGQTRSYKEIAKAIGHPKAYRAVGNANGRNPIPLIIPCHRVIESNGGFGGFGHGVWLKRKLINFERTHGI